MSDVLEIVHVDTATPKLSGLAGHYGRDNIPVAEEPTFEVWQRRTILRPSPGHVGGSVSYVLERSRHLLAAASSAPSPSHWPVPTYSNANLADDLAWYLEQFIHQPTRPGRVHANYVLRALGDWGRDVFAQLFSTEKARLAYERALDDAPYAPIEIHSGNPQVLAWPWEVLIGHVGPIMGMWCPIERHYMLHGSGERPRSLGDATGDLSVLLVTARRKLGDVDYRRVSKSLTSFSGITVTAVRPASLDQLRRVVRQSGRKWDVLHFDCHGWWGALDGKPSTGYLMLHDNNYQLIPVSVEQVLDALGAHSPSHIVLNACRSAMAGGTGDLAFPSVASSLLQSPHVDDVTAMAFNLHVDAVEPFIRNFYGTLSCGYRTSVAMQAGRDNMRLNPERTYAGGSIVVHDWIIPVTYVREDAMPERDLDQVIRIRDYEQREQQGFRCDRFVGRDDEILRLDTLITRPIPVLLIHGLAGQGKTALLREFLWWRTRTGDPRPVIWVDFEQAQGARDVLWSMAQALPDPPDTTIAMEALGDCVARFLTETSCFVVWDHLHVARDEQLNGLPHSFTEADRGHLSSWLERLDGQQSVILAASRGPERWLGQSPRCVELPLRGLKGGDRWRLVNQELKLTEPSEEQDWTDVEGSQNDGLAALVAYIAGHPLVMLDAVARVREGQEPGAVQGVLHDDLSKLRPWRVPQADAERLERSLDCLTSASALPVAPLLMLHEGMVDEGLLKQMMHQVHGDHAELLVDIAFKHMDTAGLLQERCDLHPAVSGALRTDSRIIVSNDDRRAFVKAIADLFMGIDGTNHTDRATIGTLQRALDIAIEQRWFAEAEQLGSYVANRWWQQQNIDKVWQMQNARRVQQQIVAMHDGDPDTPEALRVVLKVVGAARMGGDREGAEQWLTMAETRVRSSRKRLPRELRTHFLYERGKIAQLHDDHDGYRKAMVQAMALMKPSSSSELHGLIAYELSQIAFMAGDIGEADRNAAIALRRLHSPQQLAGAYRTQAHAKLAAGNYDEARISVQRAIALAQQAGDQLGKAMNISLLGDIEARAGNVSRAEIRFQEAIYMFEAAGNRHDAGVTYHQWAKLCYLDSRMEEAGNHFISSAQYLQETHDSASLSFVARNFRMYLDHIGTVLRTKMTIGWVSAHLPQIEGIDHGAAILQVLREANLVQSEESDHGHPSPE